MTPASFAAPSSPAIAIEAIMDRSDGAQRIELVILAPQAVLGSHKPAEKRKQMFQKPSFTKVFGSTALTALLLGAASSLLPTSLHADGIDPALMSRFEYLSTNGNSNCSAEFTEAITTMPKVTLLQGSCCSPMDQHRYVEQVNGLQKYAHVAEIPSDPYNIPAGAAQALMAYNAIELNGAEQAAYDYAMAHSDEQGPCCCECWRWEVYGGLAKFLITEKGLTGPQIAEVWDLSDGCGGDEDHDHG